MNGFVWCLSVIFVALVFSLAVVLAGSALIGVWFETKNREAKKAAEGAASALKELAELMKNDKNLGKNEEKSEENGH